MSTARALTLLHKLETEIETLDLPLRLTRESPEPPRGSVLMVHGLTGTAFQRYYHDGLYYRPQQSQGITYAQLLDLPNVFLIHRGSEIREDS